MSTGMEKTLTQIVEELKAQTSVTVKGFGTFTVKEVKARTRRNPKTGAAVQAPGFKKVAFKMSKSFRETL